ncbi:MAG: hypothetical protein Q9184_004092 [Pyrenodesmia sp. 2 TL-2023]
MLSTVTVESPARLNSISAAKEYWDSVTKQYGEVTGIVLQAKLSGGGNQAAAIAVVDSAQLDAFRKEQPNLHSRHIKLLNNHLETPKQRQPHKPRIKSYFDTAKASRFDFSWNAVRKCVIRLFSNIEHTVSQLSSDQADEVMLHIANRSDKATKKLLQEQIVGTRGNVTRGTDSGHHRRCTSSHTNPYSLCAAGGKQIQQFESLSAELLQRVVAAIDQPPVFKYLSQPERPVMSISPNGIIWYSEAPRNQHQEVATYPDHQETGVLQSVLGEGASRGISCAGKDVLVTGAGPDSIGAEVIQGSLRGGARVIATRSRPPASAASFYRIILYETVLDHEIAEKYGPQILQHAGVRLVEPELFGGYDPKRKEYLHEVAIEEDVPEFQTTQTAAEAF